MKKKETKYNFLNKLKNEFFKNGKKTFVIFPGMMQGLMQQTSSLYGCAKVTIVNYFLDVYIKKKDRFLLIKDGVTSDDSMKSLVINFNDIKKLKLESKEKYEEERLKNLEYFFHLEEMDNSLGLAFGMYENIKKSYRHHFILELNQNWVIYNRESSNPFKILGFSKRHLPSASWYENVTYGFTNIQTIARSGVDLSIIFYLMKSFGNFLNKKYSIKKEDFDKMNVKQSEIPIELNGFP